MVPEIHSVRLTEAVSLIERTTAAGPESLAPVAVILTAYYLVGVLLLSRSPEFSRTVTHTVLRRPIRALVLGFGLATAVAGLAVASFEVLWITGPFLVFVLVWVPVVLAALLYVSLAITGGMLSLVGVSHRYGALVLSGVVPTAFLLAPHDHALDFLFLGLTVLGGGAMVWSLWAHRRE